jgi:hypothetical protein
MRRLCPIDVSLAVARLDGFTEIIDAWLEGDKAVHLIRGNFAIAGAHVKDDFIEMWKDAARCFEAVDGDAGKLKMHLATTWRLGLAAVDQALPTVARQPSCP